MKSMWRTLNELFDIMPNGARRFYLIYSILTGMLAGLDTVALALVVVTMSAFASGKPIEIPLIGELPESATIWIVILVCALFILKGVLAILLHWVATRRFAGYELEVGDRIFRAFTKAPWESRSAYSTAEVTRIIDGSMANANRGFLLPLSQIPGNALTFISVLAVLIVAQPLAALLAGVYFTAVSLFVFMYISRRAREQGITSRNFTYLVARIMTEMIDALKEITLRGKLAEVGKFISTNREKATTARARLAFLAVIPKYTFESALIGGFLLVGGVVYLVQGPATAVMAVGLFAATGFRMMPAMNSVQSSFTTASSSEVYARDAIEQLHRLETQVEQPHAQATPAVTQVLQTPKMLSLTNVGFTYPKSEHAALQDINLDVPFGSRVAIVGPSGAGKSTLIDILLGLSSPTQGEIAIDGRPLDEVFNEWRTKVGYVPQRVALFDASIAQNVALTWDGEYDEARVIRALERAQLTELLDRPEGINATIGERGVSISGGQQQRLGIARALYTEPLVLVLDEATSALDTATENRVTEAMRELEGDVTFVTIAHRLSTVKDYNQICYLENGEILGKGSFASLIEQVPNFAIQARLAGLTHE